MKRLRLAALALTGLFITSVAAAQPKPRENEVPFFVPTNTAIVHGEARYESSSKHLEDTLLIGILRADYIIKIGDFALIPIAALPVVDATVYTQGVGLPEGSLASLVFHNSGAGDLVLAPTIEYYGLVQNDKDYTHTWFSLISYIYAPTGKYSTNNVVNIGDNRWTFNPMLLIGQRFLTALSFEAFGSVAFHTNNDAYILPPLPTAGVLKQDPSFDAGIILASNLSKELFVSATYYLQFGGRQRYQLPEPTGIVTSTFDHTVLHTLLIHGAIQLLNSTQILLEYSEDLAKTGTTPTFTRSRYFGIKLAQVATL